MEHNKIAQSNEEKEITFGKCRAVYIFLGIIFFFVIFMMIICLFTLDLGTLGNNSVVQFFFLVEVFIGVVIFEEYMNILIIGKDGIRIESGILVKNKKEIPYNKINSINTYSAFGFGHLEIKTGNEEITRYKFLDKYEEVEKIIKERMHKQIA